MERITGQLFALSPLPMLVYDRATLAFLEANEAAVRRYGYTHEEFLRLTLDDLRAPDEVGRPLAAAPQPHPSGGLHGIFRHRTRSGEQFDVEVFSQDAELAGHPVGVVILVDVTERHRSEGALLAAMHAADAARARAEAAERRVAFLADASARLAGSLDVEATLRTIADLAVPSLADWCFVEVLESGRVRPAAVSHSSPEMVDLAYRVLERFPVDLNAPMGTGKVLRTGEPELHRDIPPEALAAVAQDAEHLRLLEAVGFRSSLSVPLTGADGQPFAVLSLVAAESGRRFGPADLEMAQEVARRASIALASAQLYASGQAALRRAHGLQQVSTALAGALTVEQVADVVVQHGREAVGAAAGSVAVLHPDRTFEIVATHGYPDDVAQAFRRFPLVPGRPVSEAVLGKRPQYLCSLTDTEMHFPERAPALRQTGFEAFAALPIVIGPTAVGALSFSFSQRREFDPEDRAFLETLAAQTAQAFARAQLMDAERAARAESDAANRAKSEFLATMSHELRTPLNAIAGYVDLLMLGVRGPITEAQHADLERIRRSQRHLTGLINEVLNYARLESGTVRYELSQVNLTEAIAGAVQFIEPQRREKQIALDVRLPDSDRDAAQVLADAEKLQQILLNLLSNAVKFTPVQGRITIELLPESTQRGHAVLRVIDTGIGIPADKLEAVFEPFVQVGRKLNAPGEGTGLGLAISRDLARGMGGELRAESRLGEGSVFTLTLPRY